MSFTRRTYKDAAGTGYQGEITATYPELVRVFGEPDKGMDNKVKAEWVLRFDDGTIATIYDWKHYDLQPEQVTLWNIGGNKRAAVDLVLDAVANTLHEAHSIDIQQFEDGSWCCAMHETARGIS